jgi:small conductance mechanosensitive channel
MPLPLQIVNEQDIEQADSLFRASVEQRVETLTGMTWGQRFQLIGNDLWHVGLKIVVAAAIVIVGRWLIKRMANALGRMLEKWGVDPSLRTFIRSAAKTLLYFILFYLIIAWLGVNTSLFVALFAAAGLAIGMAMSGVFQNIAGGVMVLMLKPFKCGDWIELEGLAGKVMDIRLFNTVLRTADNRTILLPNGNVASSIVTNHTTARTRRLEWPVSLDLKSDFAAAQNVIMELLKAEKKINTVPAPEVVLNRITSDSIDILVHGWVSTTDYWEVYYRMSATIFETLSEKGFDMGTLQALKVTMEPSDNE